MQDLCLLNSSDLYIAIFIASYDGSLFLDDYNYATMVVADDRMLFLDSPDCDPVWCLTNEYSIVFSCRYNASRRWSRSDGLKN